MRPRNRNRLRFLQYVLLQTGFFHSSAGHFIFRVILSYIFEGVPFYTLALNSVSDTTEEMVQRLHCTCRNKRPGLRKA